MHAQCTEKSNKINTCLSAQVTTILARSDAAATIYFVTQFCAASIQERLRFQSGVY